MPDQPGHKPGADKPDQERQLQAVGQDGRGISAHGHKTGMADGQLPAVADQDIQPDGGDQGDADQVGDAQPVVAQVKRRGEEQRPGKPMNSTQCVLVRMIAISSA